jgi:hypothetical protein
MIELQSDWRLLRSEGGEHVVDVFDWDALAKTEPTHSHSF